MTEPLPTAEALALIARAREIVDEEPRTHRQTRHGDIVPTNATRLRAFIGELADALERSLTVRA